MEAPDWQPVEWLEHLSGRLNNDRPEMQLADRYYRGDAPLPEVPEQARAEYTRMLKQARTNVVRPVITALTERLRVDGFKHPDQEIADAAWTLWNRSRMPARQRGAYVDAQVKRRANLLVWPGPQGARITVEDACQTIVEVDPEDGTTVWAGLKVWSDRANDVDRANVYLPEGIYKFQRSRSAVDDVTLDRSRSKSTFEPATQSSTAPLAPRLDMGSKWQEMVDQFVRAPRELRGHVPMVPVTHRPDLDANGVSEVDDCIPIQDRIHKTIFDMLVAAEFGAFRQRWATGIEIPVDPETNEPKYEAFRQSISRMMVNPEEGGRFGTFDATELRPYLEVVEQDMEILARVKGLPPHSLTAKGEFPSGDAIRSADAPITLRATEAAEVYSDPIETAETYGLWIDGHDVELGTLRTEWKNPETRTYGEAGDWAAKLADAGVPMGLWLPTLGFDQDEVQQAVAASEARQLIAAANSDVE